MDNRSCSHYFDEATLNSYAGDGRKTFLDFKLLIVNRLLQRRGVKLIKNPIPKAKLHDSSHQLKKHVKKMYHTSRK